MTQTLIRSDTIYVSTDVTNMICRVDSMHHSFIKTSSVFSDRARSQILKARLYMKVEARGQKFQAIFKFTKIIKA